MLILHSYGKYIIFRVITIPVVFCIHSENGGRLLIGHPRLVYVTNQMTGTEIYEVLNKVLPVESDYTVAVTDGQVNIIF